MDHKNHNTHTEVNQKASGNGGGKIDFLLWGSVFSVTTLYLAFWQMENELTPYLWLHTLSGSTFELMNTIWWGIVLGMIMVGLLSKVPRQFVIAILGKGTGIGGIIRATLGGVLLDLCSHGILMVGAKLYERGASAGQLVAFLVASPWNSFSLTLVLIALIGLKWALFFIVLSLVIAIISGLLFDFFVKRGTLPSNPNFVELPEDFIFWKETRKGLKSTKFDFPFIKEMGINGVLESRMVVRWILLGVVLAGLVRAFVDTGSFQTYFGPTLAGLGLTLLIATIIEVCSEGSTPIAADLMTRANAPGNSFAFLMTGVATDYTEIVVIKETTKSWKLSLFLPLITVPQVLVISWLMNVTSLN